MNILHELEAVRKRMIQEINTEFDLLMERVVSEGIVTEGPVPEEPYESRYPLTAGAGIFKGTKPTTVIFSGRTQVHVSTWKQVVAVVMEECLKSDQNRRKLVELRGSISGRKRLLLAKTGTGMRSPLKLCDGLFMETHYDTESLLNVLTSRILGAIQYDYSHIQVAIRNR